MITAGVEGASKHKIEDEWGLAEFEVMRRYWKEHAPPVHVSLVAIAEVLGVKLNKGAADPTLINEPMPMPQGPSIAEIAAMAPVAGADIADASAQILRKMGLG